MPKLVSDIPLLMKQWDYKKNIVNPQDEADFEDLQQQLIDFEKKPKTSRAKYGSLEQQRTSHELYEDIRKSACALKDVNYVPKPFVAHPEGEEYDCPRSGIGDPLGYFGKNNAFMEFTYKEWKYFDDIYRQAIIDGTDDLKKQFSLFHLFRSSMISCNRFYFPAMNGEQCGSPRDSMHLVMATKAILDKKIKQIEEQELEDQNFED